MQFDLPTLPESYTARAASIDDVPAMVTLLRAHEEAVTGETAYTEEEAAEPFTTDKGRRDTAVVLVHSGDQLAAHFLAHRDTDARWYGDATVDPALGEADRASLAAAGLQWVERTAEAAVSGDEQIRVKHWCWDTDSAFAQCLQAAHYEPARAFIEMHIDLAGRAVHEPKPDIAIRQAMLDDLAGPDAHTVYDVISESFRDHYDYTERTFDEWIERRTQGGNTDLAGWFIAEVDGKPAGATIHDVSYVADHNANYIANLGTLRWARGRGVAKALLEHSFRRAADQGRDAVKLHVDAESPTGATALYESAGMHRAKVGMEWQRFLPPS